MKKQYTLGRFLLVGGACLLAAVLLTMQFCYRYMYLLPKEKQERQYAELSQQLELVNADGKSYKNLAAKFQAVYELYTEKELTEADEEELERELLKAFVSLIGDRYAAYYTAEEYTSLLNSTSGQSKGYGITITKNATGGAGRRPDTRAARRKKPDSGRERKFSGSTGRRFPRWATTRRRKALPRASSVPLR